MKNILSKVRLFGKVMPLFILLYFLHSCAMTKETKAIYVLIDSAESEEQQSNDLIMAMRHLLNILKPGDSIALARIDNKNFSEKDEVLRLRFDRRTAMANAQKRAFLESVKQFCQNIEPGKGNDITGGVLHAIEYLNETQASQAYILVFSDLQLNAKKDYFKNFTINFNGIHVIAMKIKKILEDEIESKKYLERTNEWANQVNAGDGKWSLLYDVKKLNEVIK